jgi:hypothetical protein
MFESPASTTARPILTLDPWSADYGSAFDFEDEESEEAPNFEVEAFVETEDWSAGVIPQALPFPDLVGFIDGVQRIESWARVDDEESSSVAVLTSVAVGCVFSTPTAADVSVDYVSRVLAVGGPTRAESLVVPMRGRSLVFDALPATGTGRHGAMQAAAVRRRDLELASIHKHLTSTPLVIADGRLIDLTRGPNQLAGIAKTLHQLYVAGEQRALIPRLGAGERTPVFLIKDSWGSRYSWFLRLPYTRPIHHAYAGIVRLEIPQDDRRSPVEVADMLSHNLPRFASRPEHDPRAPQNLLPVGGLEKRLRHEMGDQAFIRRAIEDYLSNLGGALS